MAHSGMMVVLPRKNVNSAVETWAFHSLRYTMVTCVCAATICLQTPFYPLRCVPPSVPTIRRDSLAVGPAQESCTIHLSSRQMSSRTMHKDHLDGRVSPTAQVELIIGCYPNPANNITADITVNEGELSATRCKAACSELGYSWAGIQSRERESSRWKTTDGRMSMFQSRPEEECKASRSEQFLQYPL